MICHNGNINVCYGQAYVESPGCDPVLLEESLHGQSNGICGASVPGGLMLMAGLHTGIVGLTVEVLDTEPRLSDEWEEVVEVSFQFLAPGVVLRDWDGNKVCDIPLVNRSYRVRFSAKNYGVAEDLGRFEDEDPMEKYLLQFWPAPAAPDVVIRQTRERASYWHEYASGLR